MSRAASVADGCSACSRFAREDLESFTLILSEMVEKDVASVSRGFMVVVVLILDANRMHQIELELDPDEWM